MTSLRRVREHLRALQDEMATVVQQRIVWVGHEAGESHAKAVERTLAERGLTGQEPGLMVISWQPPGHGETGARGPWR